ncbi:MAG: hypothetical protein QXL57_03155 [Candidatus Bathyarchaeia archaeon]
MSVEIPKIAVVFGSVTPPQGDVIQCRVHLGCTKEISSFEVLLQNWNKKYSPGGAYPINVGMDGSISIGRGANCPQIITCRVESVKYESTPTENYLRVSGRCWGERLFRRVFTGTFQNMKGEDIVKHLLDYYVGLSHVRDGTELVENTDTTYAKLEYENTPVFDIIKYIAESADKQGVIGYDFRVAPDGKFEFFPRNSKTSPVSLSEKIEEYEYRKDIHGIRNKITVYGIAEKSAPSDKDSWTESLAPSDGNWTAISASTVSFDAENKVKGSGSIKTYGSGEITDVGCIFTLNSGKEVNTNLYPLISFWAYRENIFYANLKLTLYDIANKSAGHTFNIGPEKWTQLQVKAGKENADLWDAENGFDWTQIKKLRFDCWLTTTSPGGFWIDCLFFGGCRYSNTQEDANSLNAYGLRELVEVDEELYSDNECMLRAKAILNHLKNPAEYLTIRSTVIGYGNTPLLPGDKIHVTLPNENVDADFRLESVEYRVDAKTQTLEITLELGRETPLLADYLCALRSKTDHVSRYKIARLI